MKSFKIIITVLFVSLIILGLGWYLSTRPTKPESDVIARKGIHWHTELKISILGQIQKIPANIGMGVNEMSIHTHKNDGVIHLEFSGLVKNDDIRLGRFFKILGKQFNKDCILDKCSGPEGQLKMIVNGKENSEFENYIMRDHDQIEIIFEKKSEEPAPLSVKEIQVFGTEFSFNPSSITLNEGERVKITFTNNGASLHNLVINGLGVGTKTIGPGQADTIEFTALASGNYNFFCSVPGHRASGMEGSLIIK